jgi:hypothetical protein
LGLLPEKQQKSIQGMKNLAAEKQCRIASPGGNRS